MQRGLAQLVARLVWDQEARGSSPRSPTFMINYKKLFWVLIILGIATFAFITLNSTIFAMLPTPFYNYIDSLGMWGPAMMMGLIICELVVLPLAGSWLFLTTSFMFGPWLAWLYTFIAAYIGCIAVFEIGKLLHHTFHGKGNNRYLNIAAKKISIIPTGVLLLFAIPLFPIDVLSLTLGYCNVARKKIYQMMGIGLLIHTGILSFLSVHIAWSENYNLLLLALVSGIILYSIIMLKLRDKKNVPVKP